MSHSLILGMTQSGKTTLAKSLANHYRLRGVGVLVYDPLRDGGWNADYVTDNWDKFLQVYWSSKSCAVFIDEAGETCGQHQKDGVLTATKGRHWGHNNHYLSQRASLIARTVRDQCTNLFLFCSSSDDGKLHTREWNDEQLQFCNKLPKGAYLHGTRFTEFQSAKVF